MVWTGREGREKKRNSHCGSLEEGGMERMKEREERRGERGKERERETHLPASFAFPFFFFSRIPGYWTSLFKFMNVVCPIREVSEKMASQRPNKKGLDLLYI